MAKKKKMRPPSFLDHYKPNFETLIRAAKADDLCLVEMRESATGNVCAGIAAVNTDSIVPLGTLAPGNPYLLYDPPAGINDGLPVSEADRKKMLAALETAETQVFTLRIVLGLQPAVFPDTEERSDEEKEKSRREISSN